MDAFGNMEPASELAGSVVAPPPRPRGSARTPKIAVCALACAVFSAGLYAVYDAMSEVLRTSGGFCASGGPYVIAHQCSGAEVRTLLVGVLAILLGGAIFAGFSAWADGPVMIPGLLMWTSLFGSLGWNFVALHALPGGGGQLVTGIVFLAMAAGGALPVLTALTAWLRRRGKPDAPPSQFQSIVRARVHPVAATTAAASVPEAPSIGPSRIVVDR
jgi:hypothetical protein